MNHGKAELMILPTSSPRAGPSWLSAVFTCCVLLNPTTLSELQDSLSVNQYFCLWLCLTTVPFAAAAAAAAKSLQSCPTLCDPRDGSPPGSPVPGILQARTLEWIAISLSFWKSFLFCPYLYNSSLSIITSWLTSYSLVTFFSRIAFHKLFHESKYQGSDFD